MCLTSIAISFVEHLPASLRLVNANICSGFYFPVTLQIMLTACLRVVTAVTNSGVSGSKCLLAFADGNEDLE